MPKRNASASPAPIAQPDFPRHIIRYHPSFDRDARCSTDFANSYADIVSSDADQDRAFDDTGYRLAATALLVHVVSLDGEPTAIEKRKLHSLIESRFGLDPGTADRLISSATRVEGEAVDLYHFTSVIMRR